MRSRWERRFKRCLKCIKVFFFSQYGLDWDYPISGIIPDLPISLTSIKLKNMNYIRFETLDSSLLFYKFYIGFCAEKVIPIVQITHILLFGNILLHAAFNIFLKQSNTKSEVYQIFVEKKPPLYTIFFEWRFFSLFFFQ